MTIESAPKHMVLSVLSGAERVADDASSVISSTSKGGEEVRSTCDPRLPPSVRISLKAQSSDAKERAAISIQMNDPEVVLDKVLELLANRFPIQAFYRVLANQQELVRSVAESPTTHFSPTGRSFTSKVTTEMYNELLRLSEDDGSPINSLSSTTMKSWLKEALATLSASELEEVTTSVSPSNTSKLAQVLIQRAQEHPLETTTAERIELAQRPQPALLLTERQATSSIITGLAPSDPTPCSPPPRATTESADAGVSLEPSAKPSIAVRRISRADSAEPKIDDADSTGKWETIDDSLLLADRETEHSNGAVSQSSNFSVPPSESDQRGTGLSLWPRALVDRVMQLSVDELLEISDGSSQHADLVELTSDEKFRAWIDNLMSIRKRVVSRTAQSAAPNPQQSASRSNRILTRTRINLEAQPAVSGIRVAPLSEPELSSEHAISVSTVKVPVGIPINTITSESQVATFAEAELQTTTLPEYAVSSVRQSGSAVIGAKPNHPGHDNSHYSGSSHSPESVSDHASLVVGSRESSAAGSYHEARRSSVSSGQVSLSKPCAVTGQQPIAASAVRPSQEAAAEVIRVDSAVEVPTPCEPSDSESVAEFRIVSTNVQDLNSQYNDGKFIGAGVEADNIASVSVGAYGEEVDVHTRDVREHASQYSSIWAHSASQDSVNSNRMWLTMIERALECERLVIDRTCRQTVSATLARVGVPAPGVELVRESEATRLIQQSPAMCGRIVKSVRYALSESFRHLCEGLGFETEGWPDYEEVEPMSAEEEARFFSGPNVLMGRYLAESAARMAIHSCAATLNNVKTIRPASEELRRILTIPTDVPERPQSAHLERLIWTRRQDALSISLNNVIDSYKWVTLEGQVPLAFVESFFKQRGAESIGESIRELPAHGREHSGARQHSEIVSTRPLTSETHEDVLNNNITSVRRTVYGSTSVVQEPRGQTTTTTSSVLITNSSHASPAQTSLTITSAPSPHPQAGSHAPGLQGYAQQRTTKYYEPVSPSESHHSHVVATAATLSRVIPQSYVQNKVESRDPETETDHLSMTRSRAIARNVDESTTTRQYIPPRMTNITTSSMALPATSMFPIIHRASSVRSPAVSPHVLTHMTSTPVTTAHIHSRVTKLVDRNDDMKTTPAIKSPYKPGFGLQSRVESPLAALEKSHSNSFLSQYHKQTSARMS